MWLLGAVKCLIHSVEQSAGSLHFVSWQEGCAVCAQYQPVLLIKHSLLFQTRSFQSKDILFFKFLWPVSEHNARAKLLDPTLFDNNQRRRYSSFFSESHHLLSNEFRLFFVMSIFPSFYSTGRGKDLSCKKFYKPCKPGFNPLAISKMFHNHLGLQGSFYISTWCKFSMHFREALKRCRE